MSLISSCRFICQPMVRPVFQNPSAFSYLPVFQKQRLLALWYPYLERQWLSSPRLRPHSDH